MLSNSAPHLSSLYWHLSFLHTQCMKTDLNQHLPIRRYRWFISGWYISMFTLGCPIRKHQNILLLSQHTPLYFRSLCAAMHLKFINYYISRLWSFVVALVYSLAQSVEWVSRTRDQVCPDSFGCQGHWNCWVQWRCRGPVHIPASTGCLTLKSLVYGSHQVEEPKTLTSEQQGCVSEMGYILSAY